MKMWVTKAVPVCRLQMLQCQTWVNIGSSVNV